MWRTATGALCQHDGVEELFCIEVHKPEANGRVELVARITMPLADLVREVLRSQSTVRVAATMTQYRSPKPTQAAGEETTQ